MTAVALPSGGARLALVGVALLVLGPSPVGGDVVPMVNGRYNPG